jgi:cell division protein FtsB
MPPDRHQALASQPKPKNPRRRLRWEYLLLAVALGFFTWKFVERMQEVRLLQREATALQAQNNSTAQDNATLQESIRYYATDPYVQQEARSVLGYTMPGDVSILTRPIIQRPIVTVRAAPRVVTPQLPTWQQWWRAIFG